MKHKIKGFGIVVMCDFIEAFMLSVLPARLELATLPLEVGCSNPLSYGSRCWYFRQESNLRPSRS